MRTNSNDPQDQEATAAWYQSESEKQLKELLALQGKMARQLRSEGIPSGDMPEDDEEAVEPTEEELRSSGIQGSGRKGIDMPVDEDEEMGEMSSDDYSEDDEEEKGMMGFVTKPIKKMMGVKGMEDNVDMEDDEEAIEPTDEELMAVQRNRTRKGGSQQGMGRPGEKGMPMARNKRNIIEGGRSGDMGGDNGKHPDEPMSRDELMKRMFGGRTKPTKGQVSRGNNGNNGRGGMKPDVKRPKPEEY